MRYVAIGALLLAAACGGGKKDFKDNAEIQKAQAEAGFVPLATFGSCTWPATVTEERTARDEISFVLKSGASQSYPGYTGYTMKVVRLTGSDGGELVAVFRTARKR